jgi:Leucine-rich repeat (LRR) protein/predicted protein tyrosine phosphatase
MASPVVVRHDAWVNARRKALTDADCSEIEKVTDLSLTGNILSSLPSTFGLCLTVLARLDLSKNRLTEIPPALLGLSALLTLNLRCNQLEGLSEGFAKGLLKLETLDVGENELLPSSLAAVRGMASLENLSLDGNGLREAALSDLPSLRRLDLRKNRLVHFPVLEGLPLLAELTLRSNGLKEVPSLAGLPALARLDVADNALHVQPAIIGRTLRDVDMSYNHLHAMPHFECCDTLESLRLSNNHIRELPEWLNRSFRSLRVLDVGHNHIGTLPLHVVELTCVALEELVVAQNRLEHISPLPSTHEHFRLKRFDFKGNQVTFEEALDLIKLEEAGKMELVHYAETVPQRLLPGVFLGSAESARNVQVLAKLGITHVLNAATARERPAPERFKYLTLELQDNADQEMLPAFGVAHAFIAEAVESGGAVLIHCQAGVSRSVTIAASFLIAKQRMTAAEALHFVQSKRPAAKPIQHFVEELKRYEKLVLTNGEHK